MVALHRDDDDRITAHGSCRITPHVPRPPFEESPRPRLHLIPNAALPRVRVDALPDHTDYRDTGCELSPSCLNSHSPAASTTNRPAPAAPASSTATARSR